MSNIGGEGINVPINFDDFFSGTLQGLGHELDRIVKKMDDLKIAAGKIPSESDKMKSALKALEQQSRSTSQGLEDVNEELDLARQNLMGNSKVSMRHGAIVSRLSPGQKYLLGRRYQGQHEAEKADAAAKKAAQVKAVRAYQKDLDAKKKAWIKHNRDLNAEYEKAQRVKRNIQIREWKREERERAAQLRAEQRAYKIFGALAKAKNQQILNRAVARQNDHLKRQEATSRRLASIHRDITIQSKFQARNRLRAEMSARREVSAIERGQDAVNRISFTFRRLFGILAAFTAARVGMQEVIGGVKRAIDFNAQIEDATLGIASLIVSTRDIEDSMGNVLKPAEALPLAMKEANRQMALLQKQALATNMSITDAVENFQIALGAAGGSGLSVDQVRNISVLIGQAAAAMGMKGNQLSEEIRSILTGTARSQNTRLLGVFGMPANEFNAKIKALRESGKLYDYLNERLAVFSIAGAKSLQNFNVIMTNFGDAMSRVTGAGGKAFFDSIKDAMQYLTLDLSRGEGLINPQAAQAASQFFDGLRDSVMQVRDALAGSDYKALGDFGGGVSAGISEAVNILIPAVEGLVQGFGDAFNLVRGIAQHIRGIGEGLGVTSNGMRDIVQVLASTSAFVVTMKGVVGVFKTIGDALYPFKQQAAMALVTNKLKATTVKLEAQQAQFAKLGNTMFKERLLVETEINYLKQKQLIYEEEKQILEAKGAAIQKGRWTTMSGILTTLLKYVAVIGAAEIAFQGLSQKLLGFPNALSLALSTAGTKIIEWIGKLSVSLRMPFHAFLLWLQGKFGSMFVWFAEQINSMVQTAKSVLPESVVKRAALDLENAKAGAAGGASSFAEALEIAAKEAEADRQAIAKWSEARRKLFVQAASEGSLPSILNVFGAGTQWLGGLVGRTASNVSGQLGFSGKENETPLETKERAAQVAERERAATIKNIELETKKLALMKKASMLRFDVLKIGYEQIGNERQLYLVQKNRLGMEIAYGQANMKHKGKLLKLETDPDRKAVLELELAIMKEELNVLRARRDSPFVPKEEDPKTSGEDGLSLFGEFMQSLEEATSEAGLESMVYDLSMQAMDGLASALSQTLVDAISAAVTGEAVDLRRIFGNLAQQLGQEMFKQIFAYLIKLAVLKAILGISTSGVSAGLSAPAGASVGGPNSASAILGGSAMGGFAGATLARARRRRAIRGFAGGGWVSGADADTRGRPGYIDRRDTVPGYLRPEEFVVRPEISRQIPDFLDKLNDGLINLGPLQRLSKSIRGTVMSKRFSAGRPFQGFAAGGSVQSVSGAQIQKGYVPANERSMERMLAGGTNAMIRFMHRNREPVKQALQLGR